MQKEFIHLTYLLTKHECVVVPSFGAFVAYPSLSSFQQDSGIFHAPVQSLGFNPELTHNDGLLAHSIMQERQISYNEASLHVQRFAEELIVLLKTQREVSISGLGKLTFSANDKIIFTPVDMPACNAVNYGLSHFQMPLLTNLNMPVISSENDRENNDVIWIPFNRRVIKIVGSVAASILFFLLFSTPLGNERTQVNDASLFTSAVNKQKTLEMYTDAQNLFESNLVNDSIRMDTTNVGDVAESKEVAPNKIVSSSACYYIVIASLPTQRTAESQLAAIQTSQFHQAAIVGNNDRFRIYVEKFTDKTEAETYLKKFRAEYPAYENAWLLSSKATS